MVQSCGHLADITRTYRIEVIVFSYTIARFAGLWWYAYPDIYFRKFCTHRCRRVRAIRKPGHRLLCCLSPRRSRTLVATSQPVIFGSVLVAFVMFVVAIFNLNHWLIDILADIRLAARALFGAAASRLSDEDTIRLVEYLFSRFCSTLPPTWYWKAIRPCGSCATCGRKYCLWKICSLISKVRPEIYLWCPSS